MPQTATAFAESPVPENRRFQWTVKLYRQLGELGVFDEDSRIELIDGDLIQMPLIGSTHAGCVEQMRRMIEEAAGEAVMVFTQNPVVLGERSEPLPDLAVLKPKSDFYRSEHPRPEDVLWLVEVSDTTVRYDQTVKVPLYARNAIPEVWLLNLPEKRLEVYHGPCRGEYRHLDYYREGTVAPKALPHAAIELGGFV